MDFPVHLLSKNEDGSADLIDCATNTTSARFRCAEFPEGCYIFALRQDENAPLPYPWSEIPVPIEIKYRNQLGQVATYGLETRQVVTCKTWVPYEDPV